MAGHAGDAAHVGADRRQDSDEADAARQSLVERAAVCFRTRIDDFTDALRRAHLRD